MIDDDLVRPSRARPVSRTAGHPGHGPEPGHLLPGARGTTLATWRVRRSCRTRWIGSAVSPTAISPSSTTLGPLDAERVLVLMGSGKAAQGDRGSPGSRRRAGRRAEGPVVSPILGGALPGRIGPRASRRSRCWIDQGTRQRGRAAVPGRGRHTSEAWSAASSPFRSVPRVIGGRYGLSSKEFTPAMVKAVFDEMARPRPKNHFTDRHPRRCHGTSLDYDPSFSTRAPTRYAVFYGLGRTAPSAPTRTPSRSSARKPTTATRATSSTTPRSPAPSRRTASPPAAAHPLHLSHRAGHLRGLPPVRVPRAAWTSCDRRPRATFLLNSPHGPEDVWDHPSRRPGTDHHQAPARLRHRRPPGGLGRPGWAGASTPSCRPVSSRSAGSCRKGEEAIAAIKHAIEKTYSKRGEAVVQKNFAAVDSTLDHLHEVRARSSHELFGSAPLGTWGGAPEFVREVAAR